MNRPRRALVSVSDKTGLEELALGLHALGIEIVSTSSTAKRIHDSGVPVTKVSDVTGFPEIMGGRVKTLHPLIHGGILARPQDKADMAKHGIQPFDLVIVNLYPFSKTVASGAPFDECNEQIDIGGPTMVRAAAKNHAYVGVITDPKDYPQVLQELRAEGGLMAETRFRLAKNAFVHTAMYDLDIAKWLGEQAGDEFPDWLGFSYQNPTVLRYGENPHQAAALYRQTGETGGLANAKQLHGKEMSYNNYQDTAAAWRAAHDFQDPCVAIIKHVNPCGIAVGTDVAEAHRKANDCDPVSAYGGVIATNRPVSVAMAEQVVEIFTEVIAAPSYEDGALEILARRKDLRVLQVDPLRGDQLESRAIPGGLLVQQADHIDKPGDDPKGWSLQAGEPVDEATLADLAFAWKACRSVKSNAILLASDSASVGVGMGQVNRVDAAKIAVQRAGDRAQGSVAASDAFFPFDDGLQVLIYAGVKAVVEPGGSVRDDQVIKAAEAAGIALYFTGVRHFAH